MAAGTPPRALVIRRAQLDAFADVALRRFEERAAEHVRRFFPDDAEALGDGDLRAVVRHGVARARGYDITRERDVYRYLNLMFTFGRDFDVDRRLPWAGEALRLPLPGPGKMQHLYARALAHEAEGRGLFGTPEPAAR